MTAMTDERLAEIDGYLVGNFWLPASMAFELVAEVRRLRAERSAEAMLSYLRGESLLAALAETEKLRAEVARLKPKAICEGCGDVAIHRDFKDDMTNICCGVGSCCNTAEPAEPGWTRGPLEVA